MTVLISLARGLTRLVALILLPLLAVVALAFAVAAVIGQSRAASLARSLQLTSAWHQVGRFLARVAPAGQSVVIIAAVGAVVLGAVLLIGSLVRTRERELHLDGEPDLGIRRRALQDALQSLPTRRPGVTSTQVRLRGRRRTARVQSTLTPRAQPEEIDAALTRELEPLTTAFALKVRVRGSLGRQRRARLS
jgi:hypothetical protein